MPGRWGAVARSAFATRQRPYRCTLMRSESNGKVAHRRYGLSGPIVAIVVRQEIVAGRIPMFLRVVRRPIIVQINRLMGHSEARSRDPA
jgi:hypothetical protein